MQPEKPERFEEPEKPQEPVEPEEPEKPKEPIKQCFFEFSMFSEAIQWGDDQICRYNTIQHSTLQYSTVQCSAVQCSAVQWNTMQCNTHTILMYINIIKAYLYSNFNAIGIIISLAFF